MQEIVDLQKSYKRTQTSLEKKKKMKNNDVIIIAYRDTIFDIITVWYLDNGASNHMSEFKHLFVKI
jgi:hypothetical protein